MVYSVLMVSNADTATRRQAMTKAAFCKALRELMQRYDKYKAQWVADFGSVQGYDAWFTSKTIGKAGTVADFMDTDIAKAEGKPACAHYSTS